MPITPDLQDDEFELTLLCPVGACLVQTTYAFNKELKKNESKYIKMAKSNMLERQQKDHEAGKHNKAEVKK